MTLDEMYHEAEEVSEEEQALRDNWYLEEAQWENEMYLEEEENA